jgi:hypothetical protein
MRQYVRTLKRRERRAPVRGFKAPDFVSEKSPRPSPIGLAALSRRRSGWERVAEDRVRVSGRPWAGNIFLLHHTSLVSRSQGSSRRSDWPLRWSRGLPIAEGEGRGEGKGSRQQSAISFCLDPLGAPACMGMRLRAALARSSPRLRSRILTLPLGFCSGPRKSIASADRLIQS